MERVSAGRALMGDSLGFHLIIIIFGVALPLLISGLELFGIITHRPRARALARTWSRALVILFIAGAVSGTVISLQFSLLWPHFMEFVSKTVGLAFALEGTAFMVEAVFLSVYMLSWDRFKPIIHWLCGVPIFLASITSAFFITSVNAFMNQPAGFTLDKNGTPIDINVHKAVFNPATLTETTHSILAYICACAAVFLAVYAWLYMKERHKADRPWFKQVILGLAIVSLVFASLTALAGDRSAKFIAKHEPYKLAAAEGLLKTQKNAPILVGGIVSGDEVKYAVKIPSMLSFLATNNFGAEIKGLEEFPANARPSMVVHYFFDGMVLAGILLILVPVAFLGLLVLKKQRLAYSKPVMGLMVVCGFAGVIAAEFGWLLTELGRQPYVIYGYMRTADAITTNPNVIKLGFIFPTFFLLLLGLTAFVLRKTMNHEGVRRVHA